MPIPGITLGYGEVLAIQTTPFVFIETQSEGLLFGLVDDVYDGADSIAAGDCFIFWEEDAQQLKYGSTIYYLLKINDINGLTMPPPP